MRLELLALGGWTMALVAGCGGASRPVPAARAPEAYVHEDDDDEMTESEIALAQQARLRSGPTAAGRVTAQSVERVGYGAPLLFVSAAIGMVVDASTLAAALAPVLPTAPARRPSSP